MEVGILQPRKKKPCGAERRRRRQQKASNLAEGVESSRDPSQEGPATSTLRAQGGTRQEEAGKRRRPPSGDTPPSAKAVAKRKKDSVLAPRSYSQAVGSELRVAIVRDAYPDASLTQSNWYAIQDIICESMGKLPPEAAKPCFENMRLMQGALVVDCTNTYSKEWLRQKVATVVPWEGAKLRLVEHSALIRPVKMSVWVPGNPTTPTVMMSRLQQQNPTIRTGDWKVYDEKKEAAGQRLILGVAQQSVPALKVLDNRPFYGLTRLKFSLLSKPTAEGKAPSPEDPAPATTTEEVKDPSLEGLSSPVTGSDDAAA